jgi:hypothetical protein
MKSVRISFLILFLFAIGNIKLSSVNQQPSFIDAQSELIIHFEGLSSKDAPQIQILVNSVNGLSFHSYCGSLDVYLVTYDNTLFTSDEFALKAITNASDNLRPVLMQGVSHATIITQCH